MAVVFALLVVAVALLWWMRYRAARLRREAETREAKMLEALFAARQAGTGNRGETIDVDEVFEGPARPGESATDTALRSAGVEADLIALVKSAAQTAASRDTAHRRPAMAEAVEAEPPRRSAPPAAAPVPAPPAEVLPGPVPVRDLVQTFYEARGYRAEPAAAEARPIELVLRHKSDPARVYAFAPIDEPVSEASARSMLDRARRIALSRVLIASESEVDHALAQALQAQGLRVYDRPLTELQFGRVDGATVTKLRAAAQLRALRRLAAAG